MFPVLNNFSDTHCMKVGLDAMISLVRVLSTGRREASSQISHLSPQKFFLKKLKAISNADLIWRRY